MLDIKAMLDAYERYAGERSNVLRLTTYTIRSISKLKRG